MVGYCFPCGEYGENVCVNEDVGEDGDQIYVE